MLFELLILAGLFLIFVGTLLLGIINWLEVREERKLSDKLNKSLLFIVLKTNIIKTIAIPK